ncbi:OmpA family protein [Chitinophagaceae bacterium MMS25-I14]
MKFIFNKIGLIAGCVSGLFLLSGNAYAQGTQGIGIHFGANDFYGPQTDKYFTDKVTQIGYNPDTDTNDTSTKNKFRWHPMVRFTYWARLNKHLDVNLGLSLGNVDYPDDKPDSMYIKRRQIDDKKNYKLLVELDARVNYNILDKERYILSPYIFAGISASHHPIYFGATVPVGVGVNVKCAKDLYLNLESAYKIAGTDHDQNHLQHSVGFVYWFKPGYRQAKPVPVAVTPIPEVPKVIDSDNDGVPDDQDACPNIAGSAAFNGCPDSDNDGISDDKDECPLVAGKAEFNGCPDSDGDGIPDQKDKCPYVAGQSQYDGCPPPDRDGDGFTDDVDKCPDQYSKTNNGCPEIKQEIIRQVEKAAKAIFFETGKSTIKKVSYKQLDAVVKVLKNEPALFADIEGHTDNVGSDAINMELSQKRAEAVRDYFVSKGISSDRLTAQGYGKTMPIATNETATGRAANRRTVIKLRNFRK